MQRDPVGVGPLSLVLIVCNPRRRFTRWTLDNLDVQLYMLGFSLHQCHLQLGCTCSFVTVPFPRISKSKLWQCESDFVAGIESRLKVSHFQVKSAKKFCILFALPFLFSILFACHLSCPKETKKSCYNSLPKERQRKFITFFSSNGEHSEW